MLYIRFFSLFMSFSLLIAPLPLSAMAQDIAINLSEKEVNVVDKDPDKSYIYLGAYLSNIAEVISQISDLDEQTDSPLSELKEYIAQGFLFAEYNDVVATLEYAATVLQKKQHLLDFDYADSLANQLKTLIHQIADGALTFDSRTMTRAPRLRTLVINENIDVLGNSVFHKHIKTKQGIRVFGKLKVAKSAKFKKNVTIEGALSVADLSVASCIDNLCVNNLSVVDESISGTLSANNAVINNAFIANLTVTATVLDSIINNVTVNQTLSANDAVINNETVTDLSATDINVQNLTVANCITNLCVNNLSVVDESISGILSVNNAFIGNLLSMNDAFVNGALRLQDPGPGYVAIQAPVTVPTSYTLSLPATVPTANQVLRANALIPTNLEWAAQGGGGGGSVLPAISKTIYVTKYGNDITGDGSFDAPYASLAQAITVANSLSSTINPITILMSTGIYIEDNSVNPLTVSADGVAIIGEVSSGVIIIPNTPTNNFLLINVPIHISDIALQSFAPLATGITFAAGNFSSIINVDFINFLLGADCIGGPSNSYAFVNCFFAENGTAVRVNNAYVEMNNNHIFGTATSSGPSVNNAVTVTGSGANLAMNGGIVGLCETGVTITNNAKTSISGVSFRLNKFDIVQNDASHLTLSGCTFELTTSSSDIDIQVSGAGTVTEIVSCEFSGSGLFGNPEGTALVVTDNASVNISGGSMYNYTTGMEIGLPSDTSSTNLFVSGLVVKNCTKDIMQQGFSTLNFNASTATSSKINVSDVANVTLAFFDLDSNSSLSIGSTTGQDTTLIQAVVTQGINPEIDYKSSLYSTQAIGFENPLHNPSSWFMLSNNNANFTAITTNRADTAGLRLVSDTGSPIGGASALRGWDVNKNGSSAELSFTYQNSDSSGQSIIPQYTVMQLDGFNNQLQLPTAGTHIVFDNDTNLYRSSANVLKTDDSLIVGTLTPNRVVITDAASNELASSAVTDTELSYVSGVTSSLQTQLNNKVSRSGDSMTGTLNMLTQNAVRLQDAIGGYVGINAPLSVPSSYTVSLPSTVPTGHQVMRANDTTPTNLEWFTPGGSMPPVSSRNIYVSKFGNDTTGDGSFASPYASLSKAINVANTLATALNPICILISPGTYIEDNSAGPLTVTANGVSIVGDTTTGVIIMPSTPTNNLLQVNTTVRIADLALQSSAPLATGLTMTTGNLSTCNSVRFANFQTGVLCLGGTVQLYGFNACLFISNGTGLSVNDSRIEAVGCSFFGTPSVVSPAVNTGMSITGAGANVIIDGGACGKCNVGFNITGNSTVTISAMAFKLNTFDIMQAGASHMVLNGSSFELTNGSSDVDIQISGAGTIAEIVGCQFNGNSLLGVPEGNSILVSDNAYLDISSGSMKNYNTALQVGLSTDTASTIISASGFTINNCSTDILQKGSAALNFNASTASSNKIIINDSTNVKLAYFDLNNNNTLTLGSTTDNNTGLIAVSIDSANPSIDYLSSLYSTQAIGYVNPLLNSSSLFMLSQNNANLTAVTTNRSDVAGLRLVSDTGSSVGGISALRGWDINKNSSSAELSFAYQNSDIAGQSVIPEYTLMQLDGVNNQLQLPTAGTQIVFDNDTNLYRSAANVLKTDDNLIVGTLTPNRVVTTDTITNQLTSSSATSTEVGYLSGATSSIQTQINNKVAKTGDSMSGALNMLTQNEVRFQDASSGEYVGINAQATIPSSYTVSLPTNIPTSKQILRANATTPTNLEWADEGGSVIPAISQTVYVTKYGNDITGDGSFDNPYATLVKAIEVANGLASSFYPIVIFMGPGNYIEDNSTGPLTITTDGITITGNSSNTTFIIPNTLSNDLLLINNTINISNITFFASGISTASAFSLALGNFSTFSNVQIINFQTGAVCAGVASIYVFDNCHFINNGTGLFSNDTNMQCNNCIIFGNNAVASNTGIDLSGAGSFFVMSGGSCALCQTGINIDNNTSVTINAASFKFNTTDIAQAGASTMTLSSCDFEVTNNPSDINIQISGAGTLAEIIGCEFNGASILNVPQATAFLVSDNANLNISSSIIKNYTTGIQVGLSGDTSSTRLNASSITIKNCTGDIIQDGSSTVNVTASSVSLDLVSINDSTNVTIAIFDTSDSNVLTIGSLADVDTSLLEAGINNAMHPGVQYKSSLYSTQAIGLHNPLSNPSSLFVQSLDNANLTAITTDRTDIAGLRLVSDTGIPVGGTSALRGWDINKNGSSAELSFAYQNSDIVGQSAVSPYTVIQFDGFNNQLQLPTAGTQIVFDNDTNLYRSSANVLKTDDSLIVGTLTPNRVVTTNSINNQLASSIVTNTELGYVSGVTSSVQTQLNSKVAKAGDIMTGTLQLPAGTTALPSLVFTGSTTTGLSAPTANSLSFSTNGAEAMKISSTGVISIDGFGTAGVVHNDSLGNLSSSLIVNGDITNTTISNAKLATISSTNTTGNIVVRDGSGNFATNMITIAGTVTNNTDVATKAYVDAAVSTGLIVKTPAVVVSLANETLSGYPTIDGVTFPSGTNSVLLTGQLTASENGLWVVAAGVWSRPADFATGSTAGEAYVLILSGNTEAGSAWLCNTPTAVVDTNPIGFELFSLPDTTTGANIGAGTGLIFRNKTGNNINFKSLLQGSHVVITNNTDDITLATDATSANTASAIVARDASNNFSAGTITASLIGAASLNVLKAGDTMTGTLIVPAGAPAAPSIQFAGSTNTGLSAATSNTLSFDTNGVERLNIDGSGNVTIDGFASTGVIHNDSSGLLSSSLIVNADVDPAAAIVDTKLATITMAGKVSNSATTATNLNTANAIVARDVSGNFSAGTIIASLMGSASNNVLKAGDTMTGTLQLPAGTTALPSLVFTGSTTTGLSTNSDALLFSTNAIERMEIASDGTISIDAFTSAGIVHNDASGNLSSSLIVNGDIGAAAGIVDTKLATISTAGKVANSATTATSANTANTIVVRDALGNFSAGTISAGLTGNVTGSASLNILKAGDTMTGTLIMPAGSAAAPSIQFTGSANTGLSAATANTLSFDISGTEQMNVSSSGVTIDGFTSAGVVHNNASGLLSTSLIVDADIIAGTISNAKLATISSSNTAGNIVVRDGLGNFSADIITANLTGNVTGNVTGSSSLNVLKVGDTMSGTLQLPAGTTALPSLVFTGSTATGLSTNTGALSFSTNAIERMKIASSGTISIDAFTSAGIVHNDTSGNLSSSLIVNGDIGAAAGIVDTKLATISTAGKVANSATTATNANTANAIVVRDVLGNFSAGTITASLTGNVTGNVTGSASNNVLKAGDTMTGTLIMPAGSAAAPSIQFTGSANTGLSAATANILSFDISGTEQMNVSSSGVTIDGLSTLGVVHNNAAGLLSTSLIVNADVDPAAAIVDTKLATIVTAGKVANSATTATSANTANTIVARDASNNFSAGTITASLTGAASLNVLKAGDTMTGALQLPAGTTALPSLVFTGSTTTGLSTNTGALSFSTNALERMKIASSGTISINAFTSAGVIHNDASGNLSSSLIVNADVAAGAAIVDTKLATISTAGKVSNSATTATSANTASAIVARDVSGNFATNMITLNGTTTNATDAASKAYVDAQVGSGGTSLNTANTVVKRDGTGSFAAQVISMVDGIHSGNLVLSTNPSTSTAGNILKGANRFIHNFGTSNTFVGENAGNFTMSGTGQNSIFGASALPDNTTGANNTAIGFGTLPACTSGSTNIAIGSGAGGGLTSGTGNIYINANAGASVEANTTRIGTSQTACFIQGIVGVTIPPGHVLTPLIDSASGQLGTINSSRRFKHDIQNMNDESNNVFKLRPVTFAYNDDKTESMQYGLIAEEVDEVFSALVVRDIDEQPYSVQYHVLPILLLNEMKKQQVTIERQEKSIENLTMTVEEMSGAIKSLQTQVQEFIERVKNIEINA